MNTQPESQQAARNVLEQFFADTRLARATELAQSERFLEAKAVLAEGGNPSGNSRELDLLARIAARQGQFGEARQLWTQALQLEPGNPTYQQCIISLTPAKRALCTIARMESKLWTLFAVTVVVLVIGTLVHLFRK